MIQVRVSIIISIHSKVWGYYPTVSSCGASYFVTFIDDYCGKVWLYVIKKKYDVSNVFKSFILSIEKKIGIEIKCS